MQKNEAENSMQPNLGLAAKTASHNSAPTLPFEGDMDGCFWNARAFFRKQGKLFNQKCSLALDLLKSCDFQGPADTHSTPETTWAYKADARNQYLQAWWSHDKAIRGGVGLVATTKISVKIRTNSGEGLGRTYPGEIGKT